MNCAVLPHKTLVRIAGEDAQALLQDVISCDVTGLPMGVARLGALLTPQGKILFEFMISRADANDFLFDLDSSQAAAFIQRMTMYRLRAKATIETIEDTFVEACWDCPETDGLLTDERFKSGRPVYRRYSSDPAISEPDGNYSLLRIEAGVAEAGQDFELSEAFPHDVLMDLNNGVSLGKGCFVGQEVVSRMQHRGTARRRIVQVAAERPLPPAGTPILSDGRPIGKMGTVSDRLGLALVRTDRVAKAMESNTPIQADEVNIALTLPSWTGLEFTTPQTQVQS